MRIARLFIHPVKSCAPIEVSEIRLDDLGVVNDRRWAVLDMSKEFDCRVMTQRQNPEMALIRPSIINPTDETLMLSLGAPGLPELRVSVPGADAGVLEATLWGVPCVSLDAGDEAAAWLQQFFGSSCSPRLAWLGARGDATRTREMCKQAAWNGGSEANSVYPAGTEVGFADGTHITLVSQASLVDLGRRMPRGAGGSIVAERFRMNVVLSATSAYEEESWKSFSIKGADFEVARLCNRCTVTLADPRTGKRGPQQGEPLTVLRSYRSKEHLLGVDRRHGTAPILGTKACSKSSGSLLCVGDAVSNVVLRGAGDRDY